MSSLSLGLGLTSIPVLANRRPANSATAWYFAQNGLSGTPWNDLSRTGLGTRIDSAGLVGYGPHNLLLNSRLAGAVAGTPGTAPTSWGLGFSTGAIAAVSTDGLTFSAAAQRIVLTQSVSVSAGSVYSVTCVVRSNSGLDFSRLLLINQVITGATSTRFANGSSVASTYVPQAGDRIEERLTTTTNSGSMQVRVGVGCDTADTGIAKLDLIRVQQGIDSGSADDLSTITTTAARYLPRITYNASTLASQGLLVEGQAVNLGTTLQFDNAAWTKNAATTTAAGVNDPYGNPAIKFRQGAGFAQHYALRVVSFSSTALVTRTFYIRPGDAGVILQYTLATGQVTGDPRVNIDPNAGTVTASDAGLTTVISAPRADGWRRVTITFAPTGTAASEYFFWVGSGTAARFAPITGNGVSGCPIYVANLEAGGVGTSDIPNPSTGTAVRAADDWFLSGDALDAALGASRNSFSLFIEWFQPSTITANARLLYLGKDDTSQRIDIYCPTASQIYGYIDEDATPGNLSATAALVAGAMNKAMIVVDGAQVRVVANGGSAITRSSVFGGAMADKLRLQHGPTAVGTSHLNSYVKTARAYPGVAMSVAQMQALTA